MVHENGHFRGYHFRDVIIKQLVFENENGSNLEGLC